MTQVDWLSIALPLIVNFEAPGGPKLDSYIVPGEEHLQATIGYGTAIPLWQHPKTISRGEAEYLLGQEIHTRYKLICTAVPQAVRDKMTPYQMAALVSWAYNCKGWFNSDSFKLLCAGKILEFFNHASRWYHGEGKSIMAGLVRRRAVELHLAERGEWERIKSAKDLNWYTGLVSVVNQGNKQKKSGRLLWKDDRLIWQIS